MLLAAAVLATSVNAVTSVTPTPTSQAICHVTAYSAIPAATAACTAITLDNIRVPGNQTLNLSKLLAGTTVTFKGTTNFDGVLANYNLITAGGTNITITSELGAIIDGNGSFWWDGQGESQDACLCTFSPDADTTI